MSATVGGAVPTPPNNTTTFLRGDATWSTPAGGGGGGPLFGGRLTLTTGTPVLSSNVSAATSIFYTPYNCDLIALYDGSVFTNTAFTELTNVTTDNTKNPAAVATNSNYDLFVWNDSSTIRLSRGPLWTSDSARGVGAGTTELVRVKGILLNANSITNGPAASRGTYVGSVRSNGTSSIDWTPLPAVDTPARLCVFNTQNRLPVSAQARDSTNTWPYNSTTIRSARGVDNVRVNVIFGLVENAVQVQYNSQYGRWSIRRCNRWDRS